MTAHPRGQEALDYDQFEILTFDCYGTLIDWERGILASVLPILDRAGVKTDGALILEAYGVLEAEIESGPYRPYKEVLAGVLAGLGLRFGFRPTGEDLAAFSESAGDWPPFSDSVAALRALKRKYRLGILSNVDNDLFARSARRLDVEFDYVFTAQDIGSYKPNPGNFDYALRRLPVSRGRVLHVAQSLFHDIAPARRIGLKTVWINRRHGEEGTGATPASEARPHAEFPDLGSFAAACGGGTVTEERR